MKICTVCGAEITSPRRKKYCSDACSRRAEACRVKAKNGGRKPPKPFRIKPCADCGRIVKMAIRSTRCPDCQRERDKQTKAEYEARKRAGKSRQIGGEYTCESCGKPYILEASLQRWCRDCRNVQNQKSKREKTAAWNRKYYSEDAHREKKNDSRRLSVEREAKCIMCGKTFMTKNAVATLCSDECRAARAKQRNHDYHVQNRASITERKRKKRAQNRAERAEAEK